MKVLITTLGKAKRSGDQVKGDVRGSYRKAHYRFEDGNVSDETSFFGLALYQHLLQNKIQPDKIVIFGTTGSMWDAWLEDNALWDENFDLFNQLAEASQSDQVNNEQLKQLSDVLQQAFNVPFECKRIPFGRNETEQISILDTISNCLSKGDELYLDVTHGFRHLPMLEMMSAFLIKHSLNITTAGLYYGALEMTTEDKITPVVSLNGLLSLQHWVEAISILKFTGNVSAIANLPELEMLKKDLNQYQFFQQMNNVAEARKIATRITDKLCKNKFPPSVKLFQEYLLHTFSWESKGTYSDRQYAQSQAAYQSGDYLRAVFLLTESMISKRVATKNYGNMMDYDTREKAKDSLDADHCEDWILLRNLRNTLAHGSRVRGKTSAPIQRLLSSEDEFRSYIKQLYEKWKP